MSKVIVKQRLLEAYPPQQYGLWKVLGEDPNCDWGGPHHRPDLGTFEGDYIDVVNHAIELPEFWSWGGGGAVEKVEHTKVTFLTEEEIMWRKLKQTSPVVRKL